MPRGMQTHVNFYVKDLEDTVSKWSKLLAILDPEVAQREPVYLDSGEGDNATRTATFINPNGLEFQFTSSVAFAKDPNFEDHVDHIHFATVDVDEQFEAIRKAGFRVNPNRFDDPNEATEVTSGENILPQVAWQKWFLVPMPGNVAVEVALPYEPVAGEWKPIENWSRDERYGLRG